MDRIIIGLVGPIASGKGLVASHLKEMGFIYQSLSDRVREETRSRGLEVTRQNLQDVGNDLREKFGGHILAQRTVEMIAESQLPVVVDSIRNPGEIEFLRQALEIKIIAITASEELRLEWYLSRAKDRGEDGTTVEDFHLANLRDLGIGETASGQQVERCIEISDFIMENNGTKEQLLDLCDHILEQCCHFTPEGKVNISKEIV